MSNEHLEPIEKLNNFIEMHGEGGLRLLFIFKTIKKAVKERATKDSYEMNWIQNKNEFDEECLKQAKVILNRGGESPTEEEIKKILFSIKNINVY